MTEAQWISVHIHYHDPLEAVVTGAVRPMVAELGGGLDGHFFVRHWQAGPHLRLRLKPRSPGDADKVLELLDRRVGEFLRDRPSRATVTEQDYREVADPLVGIERGQHEAEPLQPNNTARHVPYEPEYARYGGTPEAMGVVERHFAESSELVADLLAQGPTGDQRTGQALAMMLVCAMTAAGGSDGLADYLGTGHRDWGRRLVFGDPDAAETHFEAKYQRQRPRLLGVVEGLVRAVDSGATERAGAAVARWAGATTTLRDELRLLREGGRFAVQEVLMPPQRHREAELASVLLFCSHMHNNRLGISLPEESYLMYLLWRAVSEITGSAS
ncbi:lantibiotic dehydratase C-terminal domain-containing protein [Saccharopolyspora shandongensis]|uniref:lantibiotic dehydratase C-terminal domain-containing protein n=1 Tax=Saccharopolyspora shandongensis TaxID=418495 RepID=UPI00341F08C5